MLEFIVTTAELENILKARASNCRARATEFGQADGAYIDFMRQAGFYEFCLSHLQRGYEHVLSLEELRELLDA